jgi:hypothetical protein
MEDKMTRLIQLTMAVGLLCGGAAAQGQTFNTLFNFGGLRGDGEDPQSGVVFDRSGNLWGFASLGGGRNGTGTIFELTPPPGGVGEWTELTVHRFQDTPDGDTPESRPVLTPGGVLYGTTYLGGANRNGTAFQALPPATPGDPYIVRVIHDFGVTPGDGVPIVSGGVVFMLEPPGEPGGLWTETVLHAFGGNDGFRPIAPLIVRNGTIYSTTAQGGAFGEGTAFSLTLP